MTTTAPTSSPGAEESGADELGAQVASGLRWAMVDTGLQQVMRFAITVVLTRLVPPRQFGVLGMALVFTQLATLIGDLGLGPALIQRRDITRRHVTTAFTVTVLAGVGMTALLAALSWPIARFYGEPGLAPVVLVLSTSYVLRGIAGTPRDLLRRHFRFKTFALTSAVAVSSGGLAGIALALNGAGVWALVASVLVEGMVGAIAAVWAAYRQGVWQPGWGIDRRALADVGRFGAFVSGTRVAYYGATNLDNLIVGKVLGALALGYYNLAYRLMLFPILKVADVVATVTMPALSSVQHDLERVAAAYLRAQRNIALVCFPVSVGTAIAAPVLVPVVFGQRWAPAVVVVQILAVNGVRLAMARLNGVVYEAVGRPQLDFAMVFTTLVTNVTSFVIGVQWGIAGVAWGYTIAGFLLMPLDQWMIARALKGSIWALGKAVAPVAAATLIMAVVTGFVTTLVHANALGVMGVAIAAGTTYWGSLRLLAPSAFPQALGDLRRRAR